jgi:hypothetical protein
MASPELRFVENRLFAHGVTLSRPVSLRYFGQD